MNGLLRQTRRLCRDESGVTLVMSALLAVGLAGAVALSVDVGRISLARRQLQNAADAAALAGVRELPDKNDAKIAATSWLTKNNASYAEIQTLEISSDTKVNDTITVTLKRTVPATFARTFGITANSITVTARARQYVVVGADTTGASLFPYAVWAGNKNGIDDIKPGKSVTYRSNNYRGVNVETTAPPCTKNYKNNCNWNVNANNFKGYFHWKNSYVYLDPDTKQVQDQGGNAFGTDPADELVKFQKAGTPVWLPVVTWASDAGSGLEFIIANFACVLLDEIDQSGSSDWTGTVLDPTDARCKKSWAYITGPGEASSTMPVYTVKMVQ